MLNSLRNDLQLLKELQILDFQTIESKKNVKNVENKLKFLQGKIFACDNIISEIHRLNVENKISFDDIKRISKDNDLNAEDFLSNNDGVSVCISKIENLKIKFGEKISEQETLLQEINEEYKQSINTVISKKNGIISILNPNIAKIYNRLFGLFEDKSVVTAIEDNTCAYCRIKICLQKYVDVLKYESVVSCENCGRILLVD
jgi:predicted  nucleic acid-binding Zn-ribbon protein